MRHTTAAHQPPESSTSHIRRVPSASPLSAASSVQPNNSGRVRFDGAAFPRDPTENEQRCVPFTTKLPRDTTARNSHARSHQMKRAHKSPLPTTPQSEMHQQLNVFTASTRRGHEHEHARDEAKARSGSTNVTVILASPRVALNVQNSRFIEIQCQAPGGAHFEPSSLWADSLVT